MVSTTLPRPEALRQPGERVENQTYVVRRKQPKVHVPEVLENALKNHVYTKAQDEAGNPIMAYVPVEFDPAANQYPKALYHPDWGKSPEPSVAQYARGASTAEQYQAALDLYNAAHTEWQKGNRTRIAENEEREAELRKIGWVDYKSLKHLRPKQLKAEQDAL